MPVLHVLLAVYIVIYGFVSRKNSFFDFLYLFIVYGCPLSWTFYDGECPLTYYHKKGIDPSYKGRDSKMSDDMSSIFGKEVESFVNKYYTIICFIGYIINTISIYLVLRRQHFPILIIFMLLFTTGSYGFTILNNMHFHSFYRILLIGCFLCIFSMYLKSK